MRNVAKMMMMVVFLMNVAESKETLKQTTDPVCAQFETSWNAAERNVWEKACQSPYIEQPMDDSCPPVIRAPFLRDLFAKKAYSEKLALTGLGISFLRVQGDVDLTLLSIPGGINFDNVTFEGAVHLDGARVAGPVSFAGGTVPEISLTQAVIQGGLYASGTAIVSADGAQIAGNLIIRSRSIQPQADACANEPHPADTPSYWPPIVNLLSTNVGGEARLQNLPPTAQVDATFIRVGGSLWLLEDGGPLPDETGNDKWASGLKANFSQSTVGQDVVIRDSSIATLSLTEAKIGGSFRAEASAFQRVDAQGVQIAHEFVLDPFKTESEASSPAEDPSKQADHKWWSGPSLLNLSNSRISRVSSPRTLSAWPNTLEVGDATFDSFLASPVRSTEILAEDEWFKDWLALATKSRFNPQPYQQVANMATKSGQDKVAETVGYAKKERERDLACAQPWVTGVDCAYLTFSKYTIGYGYHYSRTVRLALFFIVLGVVAFRFVPDADREKMRYGIAYSLDTFLPVIKLRKLHENVDISNWARYYFYLHRLAGWVIGTFLVAGLAGFTK